VKEFVLPKKTLLLWQIRCFALGAILFLLALIVKDIIFLPIFVLKIFGIIDIVVTVFLTTIYMPFLFKTCKVMVINKGVVVERGIIFKNTHILPFSKLIYAQTYRTPIAMWFDLTAVTLKAARSRVFIPELKDMDAREFVKLISEEKNYD
jgi:membrane protein YdbS with pleckstrin-like domain